MDESAVTADSAGSTQTDTTWTDATRSDAEVSAADVTDSANDMAAEITRLAAHVTGVRGAVVAAVDGLLLGHGGTTGHDPHDLAALAAAAYGVGRQVGSVLSQGDNEHISMRAERGYYLVLAIDEASVLGVVAEPGLNLAQLYLEFRANVHRFSQAAKIRADVLAAAVAESFGDA